MGFSTHRLTLHGEGGRRGSSGAGERRKSYEMRPGQIFGNHYEIIKQIGKGGMSTVWQAKDRRLNRIDAIKIMSPQYALDQTFTSRFRQEAQTAANIKSDFIVQIYDYDKQNDTYYIVMEYINGNDLKQVISKYGALDTRRVAKIATQVCSALSAAHRAEVIHRDIKPQNIMVKPDGNIKVMDFGIAQPKNSHLTQDNSVLGTAHYVSPEQAKGQPLGPTTDIYSLGVVMYEACTGQLPFDGDDAIGVAMKQITEQPVPPSQVNSAVDSDFESIVLKCMAKSPADRYQSADELRSALIAYLQGTMNASGGAPTQRMSTVAEPTRIMSKPSMRPATQPGADKKTPYEDDDDDSKRKKLIIGGIIGVIAVIGVIIACVLTLGGGGTVSVPSVLGMTQDEAQKELEEAGLALGEVSEEHSDEEAGTVIEQTPNDGEQVNSGSEVDITVSLGVEKVKVPSIVGMTADEAADALEEAGLVGNVEQQYDDDTPAGEVISQSPNGEEEVDKGSTVTYQVSQGTRMADVPEVTGKDADDAEKELEDAGFKVRRSEDASDTVPSGNVISQSVTGSQPYGSTVTLTVSTGPADAKVPDVSGQMSDAARSALEEAGFKVEVSSDKVDCEQPANTVVEQSVSGSAKRGSTITLTVASGYNNVPNVVGNIKSDAVSKLDAAGFKVGGIDGIPDDAVVRAQAVSGRQDVGTTVMLSFDVDNSNDGEE